MPYGSVLSNGAALGERQNPRPPSLILGSHFISELEVRHRFIPNIQWKYVFWRLHMARIRCKPANLRSKMYPPRTWEDRSKTWDGPSKVWQKSFASKVGEKRSVFTFWRVIQVALSWPISPSLNNPACATYPQLYAGSKTCLCLSMLTSTNAH